MRSSVAARPSDTLLAPQEPRDTEDFANRAPVVLFLCAANRARSQMAEAILRNQAPGVFEVRSAGLRPEPIHPMAKQVLEEIGIDTSLLRSKSVEEFVGRARVDCAIIVCEETEELCPRLYPFCYRVLHWPFEDPVNAKGSEDERLAAFRNIRDELRDRIRQWVRENPFDDDLGREPRD